MGNRQQQQDYVRALEGVCARSFPGRDWRAVSTEELGKSARARYRDAVLQEYTRGAGTEQERKAALAQSMYQGSAARQQPMFSEDDLNELLKPLA